MNDGSCATALKVLGLDEHAGLSDAKARYHRLVHQHHPDKGGEEHVFKRVQHAFEILQARVRKTFFLCFLTSPLSNETPLVMM